ncbi:MAG: hypothetical protein K8W52_41350 [Deltaproteobacteria bacterium]|nr:hypothetical protein [Deltaproteobacteria bacterium]
MSTNRACAVSPWLKAVELANARLATYDPTVSDSMDALGNDVLIALHAAVHEFAEGLRSLGVADADIIERERARMISAGETRGVDPRAWTAAVNSLFGQVVARVVEAAGGEVQASIIGRP